MVNVWVTTAQHQQVGQQQQHEERYYVTIICDVALCHSDVTHPEYVRQRDGFPFSLDQWVALGEFYGVYTYCNTPLNQELYFYSEHSRATETAEAFLEMFFLGV